jgi:hypothetical protein
VGQEVDELPHEVGAQVVVAEAHVDMHPRDQHPPRDPREVAVERVVAVLVGVVLDLPVGEGVAGDGDGGEPVAGGVPRHARAETAEILARLADGAADAGADLDLALEELRRDLVRELGAAGLHQGLRRLGQVEAVAVDEEVLLLDAYGEFGFRQGVSSGLGTDERRRGGLARAPIDPDADSQPFGARMNGK